MTDGCFHDNDKFTIAPPLDCEKLEELFRHKIFLMNSPFQKQSFLSCTNTGIKRMFVQEQTHRVSMFLIGFPNGAQSGRMYSHRSRE